MPDLHFWFICLRAFVLAFTGALTTSLVQLSGTHTSIAGMTWLMAVLAGVVAAANAGHAAWPTPAASHHRHRHVPRPPRRVPPSPPD
jgi:hypothetical protein